ncbi:MAG TPA: pectate lyase, partial [Longimicrobium sp.]|nr:pectate lyase [Longimicrobium sp.]
CLCVSLAVAVPATAQGDEVERDTASTFAPSRLAALPTAERGAWENYLRTSREWKARDRALLADELCSLGRTKMERAPYVRASFAVTREMDEAWFAGDSAKAIAETVLSFQTPSGGWSKHVDMRAAARRPGQSFYSESDEWRYIATIDNDATTAELRFLALADRARSDPRYRAAFLRGVDYLLTAQYPNGCWPQVFPLQGGYHDAATSNDDAIVQAAALLRDVGRGEVTFVPDSVRRRAAEGAGRAVDCILAAQVVENGVKSIWGQQHDPLTLAPTHARSYEPASLATKESAAILRFLMRIDEPDARVMEAVHAAAAWLRAHRIFGYTYDFAAGRRESAGAGPLWARLVETRTGRPVFSNRDGVILYDYERLTDRRTGYAWYTEEPAAALRAYDRWAAAHPAPRP